MLCQAAAVLVALATSLAADLDAVALLAVLGERLAVAGTSDAGLGVAVGLLGRHVRVVINGTVLVESRLDVGYRAVRGQTRGRRGQARGNRGTSRRRLGCRVSSAGGGGDGDGGGLIGVLDGSSQGGDVGSLVGDGFAAGDAVVRVERAGEERVRVVSGVRLSGREGGRGARQRRTLVRQWSGLLHLLHGGEEGDKSAKGSLPRK